MKKTTETVSRDAAAVVNPRTLAGHVHRLAVDFAPRDYEHLANLNRAADYIKERLKETGGEVEEQVFNTEEWNPENKRVKLGPFRNIIAAYGPKEGELIIVGAHYDACGSHPAADDNASGVAGLIELGRLLSQESLKTRVLLVAYTLEEPPYFGTEGMGSAIHARSLKQANAQVRAMISLEMIGYYSDAPHSQAYPSPLLKLFYPSKGNFIAVVGRFSDWGLLRKTSAELKTVAGLKVKSLSAPAWLPGVDFSDQRNYWAEGYPAVIITDTAFYRNHRYHTSDDIPETLNYDRMALVVKGVHQAVVELAHASK